MCVKDRRPAKEKKGTWISEGGGPSSRRIRLETVVKRMHSKKGKARRRNEEVGAVSRRRTTSPSAEECATAKPGRSQDNACESANSSRRSSFVINTDDGGNILRIWNRLNNRGDSSLWHNADGGRIPSHQACPPSPV